VKRPQGINKMKVNGEKIKPKRKQSRPTTEKDFTLADKQWIEKIKAEDLRLKDIL
jgi:hypothetical protein